MKNKLLIGIMIGLFITMVIGVTAQSIGVISINPDLVDDKQRIIEQEKITDEEFTRQAIEEKIYNYDKVELGKIKDEFIADVNKCMYSEDYSLVVQCRDALVNIFPDEININEDIKQ